MGREKTMREERWGGGSYFLLQSDDCQTGLMRLDLCNTTNSL